MPEDVPAAVPYDAGAHSPTLAVTVVGVLAERGTGLSGSGTVVVDPATGPDGPNLRDAARHLQDAYEDVRRRRNLSRDVPLSTASTRNASATKAASSARGA
jgi:hypothetical protein